MNRSTYYVYMGMVYVCHFNSYELAMRVAQTIYDYLSAFSTSNIVVSVKEFRNGKQYDVCEWSVNNGD